MTASTSKPASLLQAKWALIGTASRTADLSAGDCAVLWQICERYNEQAGAAWPSLNTLAADTQRDRRTVQRSIAKLEKAGLVAVVKHGNRTTSNRYRPEFSRASVGAPTPLGVGAPVSEGRGAGVAKVGAPTPLESSYEPGYEAGVNNWGPSPAVAGSGGGAGPALGAPSVPPNSGRRFPEFWAAYPKARDVFKAEQAIGALLAEGVELVDLVRGARAYAAWVQAQPWPDKDKYTKGPANWLVARCWLDDHTVTPKREQPAKAPRSPQAPSNGAVARKADAANRAAVNDGRQTGLDKWHDREWLRAWEPWRRWHALNQVSNYRKAWREESARRLRERFPAWWPLVSGGMPAREVAEQAPAAVTARLIEAIQAERARLNRMRDEAAEVRQGGGA